MSACSWIHLIEPRYGVNTATVQTTFPAFLSERSLCTCYPETYPSVGPVKRRSRPDEHIGPCVIMMGARHVTIDRGCFRGAVVGW